MNNVSLQSVTKTISNKQISAYANASGDKNPLHLDDEFASSTRFGGIIAHGMLTLAFINEMLVRSFGAYWLQNGSLKVRFKGAAYPKDRLASAGDLIKETTDSNQHQLDYSILLNNHKNEEIITGSIRVTVPKNNRDSL